MDTLTVVRKRFTTDEFAQIAAAGVLGEDDRVELIEGEIVEMSPLGPQHAACVDRLNHRLQSLVQNRAIVRVQNPIRLGEYSQPQPDIALVQPRNDFYAGGHPEPEDVLLLIEVSESSLAYDRDVKLPLYARAGIVEVWLVALLPQVVEVYRAPGDSGYGEKRTLHRGQAIAPTHLPDAGLAVDHILG
jgi:Uma2 family endonuclease